MKVPTRPVRGVAPALRESVAWISSLAASSWNRFPKLFQIVPVIGLLAASAGCGQKELSGEAFAMKMVKRGDARREEVVPLAGLPVFFLTESENRRLGTRMSKVDPIPDKTL